MPKSGAQPSLFDDALNPAPASPLADSHEPRPTPSRGASYSAKDIEVLEGSEPVRKRPGMYIGGTDERALHHLFAEVLDNAMDEAVAGHAKVIEVSLDAGVANRGSQRRRLGRDRCLSGIQSVDLNHVEAARLT